MQIELSPDECALLAAVIQQELDEIGPEIHHTQSSAYRDDLRSRKDLLVQLLNRLPTPQPAGR